jgi:asparagine synthase (glutamine-hydrolysing)
VSCIAGAFGGDEESAAAAVPMMLAAMHERAPDGDRLCRRGPAVLGESFLATGSSPAEQPAAQTLDGRVWLVADARIDGRPELVRALRQRGRAVKDEAPHGELILHCYAVFGERLVEHLIGDFAFALWDADARKLLLVRDHFGIRPLYYTRVAGQVLFASDIDGLLAAPGVDGGLDEGCLAEFLLLGIQIEPARTVFRSIAALPPASLMRVTDQGMDVQSWWKLEPGPDIRYRRRQDYVDHFRQVLRTAVTDRLPRGPIALQLSAGMDSTSIAAVAVEELRLSGHSAIAYHHTTRSLIPEDDEAGPAQEVADMLGIEMACLDLGDAPLFAGAFDGPQRTAQPLSMPHLAMHARTLQLIRPSGARVLFSGFMGDAALAGRPYYYSDLLRGGRWIRLAREAAHHWDLAHSVRGMGLRSALRRRVAPPAWKPAMPDWIRTSKDSQALLAKVWSRFWYQHENALGVIAQFQMPWIAQQFSATEILPAPLVGRYPYMDLRLIEFLSGVPNNLVARKTILREAMANRLPASVLQRPKQGAAGDIARTMVTNGIIDFDIASTAWPELVSPERFTDAWRRYREGSGSDSTWASWLMVQTIALTLWLRSNYREPRKDD